MNLNSNFIFGAVVGFIVAAIFFTIKFMFPLLVTIVVLYFLYRHFTTKGVNPLVKLRLWLEGK
jgi:hypothetical protein